ncbi:MAG: ribonuclease P protein component [Actinobacteria bacterium]|nr:ribonuclease P protein component [Actinomycetota bacterium]
MGSNEKVKIIKSRSTDYFLLRIGENNLPFCRFRFVVSKKVDKRAVVRNKLRRIFSECIGKILQELNEGYDFIFIIKKNTIGVANEEICFSIKKTFEKEKLFR